MLAAFTAQSAPAFAGCAELYKEAALKRDGNQDIAFIFGMNLFVGVPTAIALAPAGIVATFGYVGAEWYLLTKINSKFKVGHELLPNSLEKVSHVLKHDPLEGANDVVYFHDSVMKSYYRIMGKAIRKGRVPSDTQPLSGEELEARTTRILEEAESKNTFCPVVKRKDGTDKQVLFTQTAIRDFVLAKILADDGVELHNLSTILRELKDDAVGGIAKGFDATKEALKKLFRKNDKQAKTDVSEAELKKVDAVNGAVNHEASHDSQIAK
ncbi:MAG: hypothetical protein HYW49_13865 [Deltaproteobacteria bacterium]|nr:hypothetical protein [Deltaproteobacteria bacterium]